MLRIRQIKVPILEDNEDTLKKQIAKKLHISINDIKIYNIRKKSIDARDKTNVYFIYEVGIYVKNEKDVLKIHKSSDVSLLKNEDYQLINKGTEKLKSKIIIVGSGPTGLFTALIFVENGYKPVIIERGECIEKRILSVEEFWKTGKLNENSNVQFGEGGAGTFSDGKLNTLVNDKLFRQKKVLETFVKFGAPKDILYLQNPHIGTDILRKVVVNMRKYIECLGGKFYFESCLTNLFIKNNCLKSIEINNQQKVKCEHLILAIGHSARDTFRMLHKNNLEMKSKPFAVGLRIEHLQEEINKMQYHNFSKYLPPASYKLTYNTLEKRGVYSFCMCPGGYVVNASSKNNYMAINGMSNFKRESKNANSAIVVSVSPKDFGNSLFDGVKFQEELEKKAFILGNGSIPVQLYKDYIDHKVSKDFGKVIPQLKGKYAFANLNLLFPNYINKALREGLENMGKKLSCFKDGNAVLSGVETRTSSPIKIIRSENFESNIKGIYPCGEGAGYAGGIMTSAVDGIKVAEKIISKYYF